MQPDFPVDPFVLGTVRTCGRCAVILFKGQQVLIQTQSSVMAVSLILQIDVWSQTISRPKVSNKKARPQNVIEITDC